MPNQLTNLAVDFVSLVDRAAVRDPSNPTEPQRFLLSKADVPVFKASGANPNPPGGSMTEQEMRAAVAKAEKRAEKAERKLAKAQGDTSKPVQVDKSQLAPEVRALVEKAEKDARETRERAEKAEKIAKAEREQRVRKEFIAKAEKDFPHLGNAEELGPELMRMSESLSKEDYDSHLQRLTAANAQIETGNLFAELGRGGDAPGGVDELQRLNKAVEDIRKADSNLTPYQAREEALRRDPKLAAALVAANR